MSESVHNEAKLDTRYIQVVKLLNIYLNHFPRHEKHGLALQIRNTSYEMYALMVEAQKRYIKKTTLTNLDIKHEQLRMFTRLAYELGYFGHPVVNQFESTKLNFKRYSSLSKGIDEIGRMIGGWINHTKQTDLARSTNKK